MGYADAFCTMMLPANLCPWLEVLSELVVPLATIAFLFYPIARHRVVYVGWSGQKLPRDDSFASASPPRSSQTQFRPQSVSFTEQKSRKTGGVWATVWESVLSSPCIPCLRTKPPTKAEHIGADLSRRGDWWGPADFCSARGLECAVQLSTLLETRVIRHGVLPGSWALPWHANQSMEIYRQMGMRNSASSYIAAWLSLDTASFLFVSQVLDKERLQLCTGRDALMSRLKLVLRPVRATLPFPAKAAPEADTIGAFFGLERSSCVQHCSNDGIHYTSIQVALYSKWQFRLAMKTFGFRKGNVLEILIVDWPGRAVLACSRISVTPDLLLLLE